MNRKKLAIIGASYLQKPLVLKASEMNIHTICFAWEDGAVCKDICDEFYPISITEKEEILKVCSELEIDGVLSIASDVAVPTVNYIANKLNLIGNSIESSNLSTNKYLMRKAFNKCNIPIPKFIKINEGYDLDEISELRYPIVIKPVDRSGSKGITVLKEKDGIKKAIDYGLKESFVKQAIIEEFIEGQEISVEGISHNGRHNIITYTDKITTGFPHFVELEHHQPSKYLNSELKEKINQIVLKGIDSLYIKNGATHSECIINADNDVYLTEIGARMGGDFIGSDLVELSTGYDYLKGVIKISLGELEEIKINKSLFSGIYFYTNQTEKVKNIFDEKHFSIIKGEFWKLNKRRVKQSSERSGYFIYQSEKKLIVN